MKGYLALCSLLLLSYAAPAQIPDSVTGRQRLDGENGLLGIKFGTLQRRIHGLKKHGRYSYIRRHAHSKLGSSKVKSVQYYFTDIQPSLFAFTIYLADSSAAPQVLQLLQASYGPTKRQANGYYDWRGSRIRLSYRYGESIHILDKSIMPSRYYSNPLK